MKYLRWQGAVTFFALLLTIITLLYVFAEPIVKKGLETGISWYTGAEVNISEVELAFSPLSLTVNDLQATDAEKPTQNILAFSQAKADIDLWQYLFGKILINDLSIEGLAFSTPRQSPGEVYTAESAAQPSESEKSSDDGLSSVKQHLPDAKTVIENADLLTVKASKDLSAAYKKEKQTLASLQSDLPDKAKLKVYQDKVKALGKVKIKSLADLEKLKQEYDTLKAAFKADKQAVKQAKLQLTEAKTRLMGKVNALKDAPNADWQNIKSEYQLDSIESGDFAHVLFGEQAREYVDVALMVYEKLAPLIANKETPAQEEKTQKMGRFVFFDEQAPTPELLIHNIHIAITMPQGDFALQVKELTYQHWLIDNKTHFELNSTNVYNSGIAQVNGDFFLKEQGDFISAGDWSLQQLALADKALRNTKSLTLKLSKGVVNASGSYQLENDMITSENNMVLTDASYDGQAQGHLRKLVVSTLKSTPEMDLSLTAEGNIAKPSLSISSSLDKALKNALASQLNEKAAEFKADIQSGLNAKVADALKIQEQDANDIINVEALLNESDGALDSLLKSDVIKQQEKKLKDKAKDKLKDKLGSFFK